MSTYRLWYGCQYNEHWSKYSNSIFTDLAEARAYCDNANNEMGDDLYRVAGVNEDGTPNFGPFDARLRNTVELREKLEGKIKEVLLDYQTPPSEELDTPIPYTLNSALDFIPPVSVSPDAKRFVDIEDLRSAANAVTTHNLGWRVGCNQVRVQGPKGQARVLFNGIVISREEAHALKYALEGALDAVA